MPDNTKLKDDAQWPILAALLAIVIERAEATTFWQGRGVVPRLALAQLLGPSAFTCITVLADVVSACRSAYDQEETSMYATS